MISPQIDPAERAVVLQALADWGFTTGKGSRHLASHILDKLRAERASGEQRALIQDQAAYRIRAELVCCHIYDVVQTEAAGLEALGVSGPHENAIGRAVLRGDWHDLCYWAEAAARIAEGHCPGYETEPNICRCACEGCKHNCSAHKEDETVKDPRDMVGDNPTGNPTRSSGARRARAARRVAGREEMRRREEQENDG